MNGANNGAPFSVGRHGPLATALPPATPLIRPDRNVASTTAWSVVVEAFLDDALDCDSTRRAYRRHLYRAYAFLGVVAVAQLSGTQLAGYRAAILSAPLTPASLAQALAAVRSFLTWSRTMGAHGLPAEVLQAALRTPRTTVRRLYHLRLDAARPLDAI